MPCPFCNQEVISEKPFRCVNDECRSKVLNKQSKEYIKVKNGWTDEQVKEYLSSKTKAGHSKRDHSVNPNSREAWRRRGLSEEEIDTVMKAKGQKVSKTRKELGLGRGDSNSMSKKKMLESGMSAEDVELFTRSRIHSCPEYWEKRGYDRQQAEKLAADAGKTITKEKLGEEGFKLAKHRMSKVGRMEKLIKEVGIENAENEFIKRYIKNSYIKVGRSSKHAMRLFLPIYKMLRKSGMTKKDFFIGTHKRNEMFIRDGNDIFFYDFVIKPLNLIFEFKGTHVHPSPNMSIEERNQWRHAYSKCSADEVDKKDNRKKIVAESRGYVLYYIYSNNTDEHNISEMERIIKCKMQDVKRNSLTRR